MCGHSFHSDCIDAYMRATGKERRHCCVFKCHQMAAVANRLAEMEGENQDAPSTQEMPFGEDVEGAQAAIVLPP